MGRLKLILSNLVTALVVCAATSAFWIYAFNNSRAQPQEPVGFAALPERGGGLPSRRANDAPERVEVSVGPSGLAIPVAGVDAADLIDTYKQARAGGARVHDAIDIIADHGTPVVAAAPGRLEKLFFSEGGGGITAYVRSKDGQWLYYYAHLQDYAPGLKEGQAIKRGDPIGRVGVTGNSDPNGPHLHFAIYRMRDGEDWHEGTPVNPYPLLAGRSR